MSSRACRDFVLRHELQHAGNRSDARKRSGEGVVEGGQGPHEPQLLRDIGDAAIKTAAICAGMTGAPRTLTSPR